jgi:hypothetical protein
MLILSVLMALPFALGWLAGALWTVVAVAWTACAEGFRTGARRPAGEDAPG